MTKRNIKELKKVINIKDIFKTKIVSHGTGARIIAKKEHIGKYVLVIVTDKELDVEDKYVIKDKEF